jgi:hypothetical protein
MIVQEGRRVLLTCTAKEKDFVGQPILNGSIPFLFHGTRCSEDNLQARRALEGTIQS